MCDNINLSEKNLSHMINGSDEINTIPYVDSDPTDPSQPLLNGTIHGGHRSERKASLVERRNVNLNVYIVNGDDHITTVDEKKTKYKNNNNNNNNIIPNGTRSPETSSPDVYETPGPLITVPPASHGLRRNSISLPAGLNKLDISALQEAHNEIIHGNDDGHSIASNIPEPIVPDIKTDDDDDDEEAEKKPIFHQKFRSKRKLSVAPLPAIRLNDKEMMANDFDNASNLSNQNSITSINSLASLLKEKMQAFPSMIRKKKKETKDYKIKVFVAILFLIIIFLVGYAYIMYHQQILTKSYFDRVKFNKAERMLRVYNTKDDLVLRGFLGTTIMTDEPFNCLSDDMFNDGSVCLEWSGWARMYMNLDVNDVKRCYTIRWQALDENIFPTDCYDFSKESGYWFGGGLTKEADWPFNEADFPFQPFITGDAKVHQFGNAVKRYFINSRGVAIQIDDKTPLQISMNSTSKRFCMRAQNDDFAFVNRLTPLPVLAYKICTADDMRTLHKSMTQQSLWDGMKQEDMRTLHTLLDEPVWQIPALDQRFLNENTIYNYSEDVIAMGFMRLGHILVNEFWQESIGDFSVDEARFATLENLINVLHRRGFRIVLTIQPFISTDSKNFKDAVKNKLLIYERHSERSIPALTRYKSASSAGVLDITNNASIPWLVNKLKKVVKEYQIDAFYLDLGNAYNMPHYYQCRKQLDNPDVYGRVFASSLDESVDYIGVSKAITVPRPPAFLSLPPVNSSWEGLKSLVISVLNYGILGYPFIIPGPVGGDYHLATNYTKMLSFYTLEQPPLPTQELYIRWLQLVTFLPVIQFSHLPSEYKSDYVTEIAKELTTIRQKTVIPILKKYLSESMNEGLPVLRPLWMLDPHDPACLSVNDEFSVGEELIVAPILQKGHTSREVYLPQGVWKDGVDGSLRKGSRWIHNYRVPEDKVAYFVKMPDNTRF